MVPISQHSDPSPGPGMGQGLLPAAAAAAKSWLHTHPCSQQHTPVSQRRAGRDKAQCRVGPMGQSSAVGPIPCSNTMAEDAEAGIFPLLGTDEGWSRSVLAGGVGDCRALMGMGTSGVLQSPGSVQCPLCAGMSCTGHHHESGLLRPFPSDCRTVGCPSSA